MTTQGLERWSALSGLVAVILFSAGAALFGIYEYLPSAETLRTQLVDNNAAVAAGGYLGTISAFFLVWFAGALRRLLKDRSEADDWLSTLSLGGGVAAGAMLAIGFSAIVASAARAGAAGGIAADEALALYDIYGQVLGQAFAVAMAVQIAAVAAQALRTALLPGWASWLSLVVVVGLLSPFAYAALAGVLVWLVAISLWAFRKST